MGSSNTDETAISVVTPFYNTAPYLAQCIESVLAQTHRNFEYVLVDNQSTDGSAEIAASYKRAAGFHPDVLNERASLNARIPA